MDIKKETQQYQKIKDVTKTIRGNCDKIVIDMFNTIEKESNVTEETNASRTES
jgi:predicted dinucleotide-binding enzyme